MAKRASDKPKVAIKQKLKHVSDNFKTDSYSAQPFHHPILSQENHEINLAVHLLWRTFVKNYILLWQKTV